MMGLLLWPSKADVRALREIDVSPEEFQRTQVRLLCVCTRVCVFVCVSAHIDADCTVLLYTKD